MGKSDFILDYLPYFNGIFYNPILNEEPDGVDKVISMLIEYDFTKEDWDEMVDLYQWNNLKLPAIPTKLKSAFTRTYNKTSRLLPYSLISASITKSKSIDDNFENDEETADEDNDNIEEKDPMLKTTETNVSKSKESKTPKRKKLKQ